MRMNKIRRRRFILALVVLFILGFIFCTLGFKECESIIYAYKEDNSVNYKVYLKANKFFDTAYLEKDKTYITSLINYIDSDFVYKVNFNEFVSGSIDYQIFAEIRADKMGAETGNYWTKKYELSKIQTNPIISKTSHVITAKQKIEYNKFNDLMKSFIEEYGLQTEASLKVYLKVDGNVRIDGTDQDLTINSELDLTVPLSKLAIEGKVETNNNNNEKEIMKKADEMEPYRDLCKVLFAIVVAIFVISLFRYVKFLLNRNKFLNYTDKIKKINMDYEDIITKVKSVSKDKYATIEVETFDDLLNVYTSIREPINFLYGNTESKYFIVKDNTCYMYTIIKEDAVNETKKKKPKQEK